MICPACGYENMPGQDRCVRCESSMMQEDLPHPDDAVRWRVMVDPISSLEASHIEPQIAPSGTPLPEGIRRMQGKNVGYLLVTGADGKLIGILTEHDLLLRVATLRSDLDTLTVDDVMTRNPTSLKQSEPIKHALHFMATNDFMYLPLVDEAGRPVDMLSFRRVARLIEQME